ncbi:lachesin-like [Schistocerca cancellata]|uniref:lachesin-like n=1 Tax=Schistocerca cancellata TaxID=274614 RepID=UPI00211963A1|nr:lachesin-like [Schistocerca cancellata]
MTCCDLKTVLETSEETRQNRSTGSTACLAVNVLDGEQLSLSRISRTEMGAYLCIATNGVPPSVSKRITVDVEFPPMIWVPNQLVGAPAGTNVTLDCHTEAHPRAITYWLRAGAMVLPAAGKLRLEAAENSYRGHMRLTVAQLAAPHDFGSYRCIAKNSLGETEGSIRLYGGARWPEARLLLVLLLVLVLAAGRLA